MKEIFENVNFKQVLETNELGHHLDICATNAETVQTYKIESAVTVVEKVHPRYRIEVLNHEIRAFNEQPITLYQRCAVVNLDRFEILVCRVGYHSNNVATVNIYSPRKYTHVHLEHIPDKRINNLKILAVKKHKRNCS